MGVRGLVILSLLFSNISVAAEFVTLQCSGEQQTVNNSRQAKALAQATGTSGSKPFTILYKVSFDKNNPVVMIKGENGEFVQIEGGKQKRHSVYECASGEFEIKCNFVSSVGDSVFKRELVISRADGAYSSSFAMLGGSGFNVYEKGFCKKVDAKDILF